MIPVPCILRRTTHAMHAGGLTSTHSRRGLVSATPRIGARTPPDGLLPLSDNSESGSVSSAVLALATDASSKYGPTTTRTRLSLPACMAPLKPLPFSARNKSMARISPAAATPARTGPASVSHERPAWAEAAPTLFDAIFPATEAVAGAEEPSPSSSGRRVPEAARPGRALRSQAPLRGRAYVWLRGPCLTQASAFTIKASASAGSSHIPDFDSKQQIQVSHRLVVLRVKSQRLFQHLVCPPPLRQILVPQVLAHVSVRNPVLFLLAARGLLCALIFREDRRPIEHAHRVPGCLVLRIDCRKLLGPFASLAKLFPIHCDRGHSRYRLLVASISRQHFFILPASSRKKPCVRRLLLRVEIAHQGIREKQLGLKVSRL